MASPEPNYIIDVESVINMAIFLDALSLDFADYMNKHTVFTSPIMKELFGEVMEI